MYRILACLLLMCQITLINAATAVEISIQSGIGPASADFIERSIRDNQDAHLFIIRLDTPGGLDQSTRAIVQSILNAPMPVITYVAPSGARAASAGTVILYASTIAAMAPGTHLGAASPVSLTGDLPGRDDDSKNKSSSNQSTMSKKITNDMLAYVRTLAQLRGRDVAFAEAAVRDAATKTAQEALKDGVIDVIAKNQKDLLSLINGKVVLQNNRSITIDTTNLNIKTLEPDWRMRFLLLITSPTVAYVLLLLGVYGIFFELFNPGFIVPGVIGAVALLMAMYALQMLPINYAGLGLILLGISFMVAEAFSPSFGVLGIGGTVSFVVGSILLMDSDLPHMQIAWHAILAMALFNVLILTLLVGMVIKARRAPLQQGLSTMVNQTGVVILPLSPIGQIMINGEIWTAKSPYPIEKGAVVRVVQAEGLTLLVEKEN